MPRKPIFSPVPAAAEGFAGRPNTFAKPSPGLCAKKLQIEWIPLLEQKMLQLLDDHPNASLWLIAVAQGAAMLGFNVLLRTLLA